MVYKLNTAETFFLEVLSNSVHHNYVTDNPLRPDEWDAILALARVHNVFPLVFEKSLENESFTTLPEYQYLAFETMSIVAGQARRTETFLSLYKQMIEVDIHPIVMKGIICRQLYGEFCDHRPSRDEDILIHKSEYESVKDIFIKNGYFPDKKYVTEEQKEELQEITFLNSDTGLAIEVHLNLMGHGNNLETKMNSYFEKAFDNSVEVEIDGVTVTTMCATDHYLYLILHAFRHFLAGGFGIRQVLDILLFEQKYADKIDQDYIVRSLREVHADKFLGDLIHIGNKYLGFRLSEISPQNCLDELLEDLFYGGIFGNETHEERTALELTKAAVANVHSSEHSKKSGRFTTLGTICKLVFPSKRQIINSYPELEKSSWKLPVCWVRRWLKYLKYRELSNGNLAAESMKISKRRIELLKKYDIL